MQRTHHQLLRVGAEAQRPDRVLVVVEGPQRAPRAAVGRTRDDLGAAALAVAPHTDAHTLLAVGQPGDDLAFRALHDPALAILDVHLVDRGQQLLAGFGHLQQHVAAVTWQPVDNLVLQLPAAAAQPQTCRGIAEVQCQRLAAGGRDRHQPRLQRADKPAARGITHAGQQALVADPAHPVELELLVVAAGQRTQAAAVGRLCDDNGAPLLVQQRGDLQSVRRQAHTGQPRQPRKVLQRLAHWRADCHFGGSRGHGRQGQHAGDEVGQAHGRRHWQRRGF